MQPDGLGGSSRELSLGASDDHSPVSVGPADAERSAATLCLAVMAAVSHTALSQPPCPAVRGPSLSCDLDRIRLALAARPLTRARSVVLQQLAGAPGARAEIVSARAQCQAASVASSRQLRRTCLPPSGRGCLQSML